MNDALPETIQGNTGHMPCATLIILPHKTKTTSPHFLHSAFNDLPKPLTALHTFNSCIKPLKALHGC